MKQRLIHIDQDCFFAAVEMRDRGIGRQTPVAVGGSDRRRGVITTCNYKARSYGCHSGMPTFQALQLCPQLTLIRGDYAKYQEESRKIRLIFAQYTKLIEPLSLDEATLDVSDHPTGSWQIAQEIRQKIRQELRLPSSAGIAPNKMLAKIASDWDKPNGQFAINEAEIAAFMQELPIKKIPGIGPKTQAKLYALGIATCGELQHLTPFEMSRHFHSWGQELYQLARGQDHRPVNPHRIRKSISHENTYSPHLEKLEDCQEPLQYLHQQLMADYQNKHAHRRIQGIFCKIKTDQFLVKTAANSQQNYQLPAFQQLLETLWQRKPQAQKLRLLGIGLRLHHPLTSKRQLEFPYFSA